MKNIRVTELKYLYLKKKLSSKKIASVYGCSPATIIKKLRKARIPVRKSYKIIDVPESKLIELYVEKKLSTWKIEKILKISRSTVHRKLKSMKKIRTRSQAHIIYERRSFDGSLKEKAYIIGFSLGDLRARKFYKNSETIFVDCGSTKIDQINLFKNLFEKYGKVWTGKPDSKGRIQMQVLLNMSFEFLLNCEKEFYKWIDGNPKYFIHFLAGFTDAEGSIFLRKDKNPTFAIGNYNKKVLEKIRENLRKIDIETKKIFQDKHLYVNSEGYKRKGFYCHFRVDRRGTIVKLLGVLKPYLRHKKRINDLNTAIKSINNKIKIETRGDRIP